MSLRRLAATRRLDAAPGFQFAKGVAPILLSQTFGVAKCFGEIISGDSQMVRSRMFLSMICTGLLITAGACSRKSDELSGTPINQQKKVEGSESTNPSQASSKAAEAPKNSEGTSKDPRQAPTKDTNATNSSSTSYAATTDAVQTTGNQYAACPAGQYLATDGYCYLNPYLKCPSGQILHADGYCRSPVTNAPDRSNQQPAWICPKGYYLASDGWCYNYF